MTGSDPGGNLWYYGNTPISSSVSIQTLKKTKLVIRNLLRRNGETAAKIIGKDYLKFAEYVGDKKIWDYKRDEVRDNDPILKEIKDIPYVMIGNTLLSWHDFGNFHYGYVGKKAGFSYFPELIVGSLYAAKFNWDDNEKKDEIWIGVGYFYEGN